MTRGLFLFFLLFVSNVIAFSQVFPEENMTLHYRIIGFTFPKVDKAQMYKIEVALGDYSDVGSFKKHIVTSQSSASNKVIVEVPAFGQQYTWRVTTDINRNENTLHHFSTLTCQWVDTGKLRLRVVEQAKVFSDGYVFVDDARTMYDMKGNPVWFLPEKACSIDDMGLMDFKITDRGTITFVYAGRINEIDYNANVINKVPSVDFANDLVTSRIHHEGGILKNGHFMGVGSDNFYLKYFDYKNKIAKNAQDSAKMYCFFQFSTVNEYDSTGKLVWNWQVYDYIKKSELMDIITSLDSKIMDIHTNAFYFDEANGYIYVGIKNINRIVKVKYPEGRVESVFGKTYSSTDKSLDQELFCAQHSCRTTPNGELFVYNNNACNDFDNPKLIILREDKYSEYGVKKVWEYACDTQINNLVGVHRIETRDVKQRRSRGGNMYPISGGYIFASLNIPHAGIFIMNREKKIFWKAVIERWNDENSYWMLGGTYRSSLVEQRKGLEDLIWHK